LFYDNLGKQEKMYGFFVNQSDIIINKFWKNFNLCNLLYYKKLKFIYVFIRNTFDVLLLDKDLFFVIYEFFSENKDKHINFFLNSIEFISIINRIEGKNKRSK
jgi:hypothetical protein